MWKWFERAILRLGLFVRPVSPRRPGEWGERVAECHLRRAGIRIIGRNVRVGRRDELDLIGWDSDTLVFVEVKTRASEEFGPPVSAVGPAKRRHLSRAAVRFLRGRYRGPPPAYLRFDVVEVVGRPDQGKPLVRHLRNVFPLEGGYRP
ncbi:MAG: YraN family protein [Kiritimatiellae bacterium]|nr:YraN family protein [Kiritimatiellia bacterium]